MLSVAGSSNAMPWMKLSRIVIPGRSPPAFSSAMPMAVSTSPTRSRPSIVTPPTETRMPRVTPPTSTTVSAAVPGVRDPTGTPVCAPARRIACPTVKASAKVPGPMWTVSPPFA